MKTQGFTLLELMIVTAIFALVLYAATVGMMVASEELAVGLPESELQNDAQRATRRLRDMLADASASQVVVGPEGDWVSFVVPVDPFSAGGDPLEADYTVCWGARLGALVEAPGGIGVFQFERVDRVREADLNGINVNRNTELIKDTTDVFDRGRLAYIYDPDASFPVMTGDERISYFTGPWLVQVDEGGSYGGDIDGDGNPDPLFAFGGQTLTVNLWSLSVVRSEKMPLLINVRSAFNLENP